MVSMFDIHNVSKDYFKKFKKITSLEKQSLFDMFNIAAIIIIIL